MVNKVCENSPDFSFTLPDGVFTYDGLKNYVKHALQAAVKETFVTKSEKYIMIDPACFTLFGRAGSTFI
jgi:hypothetical protein